jgi:hypothetical protein
MANLLTRRERGQITSDTVIYFDHIPKCAGTSIYSWFEEQVGTDRLRGMYMKEDLLAMKNEPDHRCRVVIGHFVRGMHHCLPADRQATYCTMLRHPVRTAISSYVYGRKQFALDNDLDIETYLLEYRPNPFTWHLGQDDFEKAKETLFQTYCAFGLVEQYDRSLRHFAATLLRHDHRPPTARCNVSGSGATPAVHPEILARFRRLNAADLALYDLAVEEFRKRTAQETATAPLVDMAPRPERVEYTKTFEDVRRALEADDYPQAISLLAKKHLGDMPHHILAPAAVLAVSHKDFEAAGRLFDRLRSKCPYFYMREYVDYLLAIQDIPRAIAAVEEECRQYEDWPDSRTGSDLFWFKVEALCLLLYVRRKAAGVLDAGLLARLEALCRFSEHATSWLLGTLMRLEEYAEVLRLVETPGTLLIPGSVRFRILLNAARASFALDRLPESAAYCREVLELQPYESSAIMLTVLLHRKNGGHVREIAPYETLALTFSNRRFTRGIAKELAVSLYAGGFPDRAFKLVDTIGDGANTAQLDGNPVDCRPIPFADAVLGDFVLIKAGPQMVFDYLAREFAALREGSFDLVGGLAGPPPANLRRASPFLKPRYEHERDHAAVISGLGRRDYEAVVVVLSDFDIQVYREILTLARSLTNGPVYLYSFDHMTCGRHRRNLTRYA